MGPARKKGCPRRPTSIVIVGLPGIDLNLRSPIDIKVAKALSRAVEQAGIRTSQKSRRLGDYILGDLIADGPGYQDRLAKHVSFDRCLLPGSAIHGRLASSEHDRRRLKAAAAREFQIIQTLDHQGILPVLDYKDHENGPALLFRYRDPNAVRLDHYLATNCHKLRPPINASTCCVRLPMPFDTPTARGSSIEPLTAEHSCH